MEAILDLFATNKPGLVKSINNGPGISYDHDIIIIDSDVRARTTKKSPRNIYKWTKADWDNIKADTSAFADRYQEKSRENNIEENHKLIEDHLKDMLDKHVPSKLSRTRIDLPWLTPDLNTKFRRNQCLYNKAKKSGKDKHKKHYKSSQKATRTALKQARWRYINEILQTGLEKGNSKPFWKYVRSQKQENLGVSALKKQGQLHSDRQAKCDILAKQYRSVFTRDTKLYEPAHPPIDNLVINEEGVKKLLLGINPNKVSGPDQIPCRLLRELATELTPVLTNFFRQSLNMGQLPQVWTKAWISPIFKKGSRCQPENYKPVSLTCITCKLFEHILCSHIRGHLDRQGILTPFNHGFRGRHSCESQLLVTTHDMLQWVDRGEQVDVAILDFSKAFDTVPHHRLLHKLQFCGIDGDIHLWIKNFLATRTQSILIDGDRPREDPVESGVPQGTVLCPLLFLIYISDLPSVLDPNTAVRLFSDDCLIYKSIHNTQEQVQLQHDLDALELWGRNWGIKFNMAKCNIIRMGRVRLSYLYQLKKGHPRWSDPSKVCRPTHLQWPKLGASHIFHNLWGPSETRLRATQPPWQSSQVSRNSLYKLSTLQARILLHHLGSHPSKAPVSTGTYPAPSSTVDPQLIWHCQRYWSPPRPGMERPGEPASWSKTHLTIKDYKRTFGHTSWWSEHQEDPTQKPERRPPPGKTPCQSPFLTPLAFHHI